MERQSRFFGSKVNHAGRVLIILWVKDDDALAVQGALDEQHGTHNAFACAGCTDNLHVRCVVLLPRDVNGFAAVIKTGKDPLLKSEIAARVVGWALGFIEALADVREAVNCWL